MTDAYEERYGFDRRTAFVLLSSAAVVAGAYFLDDLPWMAKVAAYLLFGAVAC